MWDCVKGFIEVQQVTSVALLFSTPHGHSIIEGPLVDPAGFDPDGAVAVPNHLPVL